jgi:hypothetical protein
MQSCCVSGGVQVPERHWKQAMSVSGSEQFTVPEPEPEPLPLPLPLEQSAGHEAPFSPFVVSHMPLPHELVLLPLPLPQSCMQ